MKKKHFELLADQLRRVRPGIHVLDDGRSSAEYNAWFASVKAVAQACALDNEKFNHNRFLEACGIPYAAVKGVRHD